MTDTTDATASPDHDHDHTHGHSHGTSENPRKLALVAVINSIGFVAELVGGLLFGSVALLSDAVHMLFDALAYIMAFAAAYVATNFDTSERWSYGLHRLEPLSAFLNGALLIPMVGFILYESYQRFFHPVPIDTIPTLVLAVFGLLINAVSVYVIEGDEMSLNERGAFYHLLGDAGGSIAVIVSVLVVEYTGIQMIDPITAVLISAIIVWSAVQLLKGSGAIFLHKSPFDVGEVRAAIKEVDGVDAIDDLHAWQICSELTIATTHVETTVETRDESEQTKRQIHDVLAANGVNHATVELCAEYDDRPTHLNSHTH
jgi:cobalt-zinc-cadmium efflux system protein